MFVVVLLNIAAWHVVCFETKLIACLCFPILAAAVLCETITMVTASKMKHTPRRRRRERQRSLIEEQETLSRVVRGDTNATRDENGRTDVEKNTPCYVRRRPVMTESRDTESHDTEQTQSRVEYRQTNGVKDAWSEGPVQIKSMCMLNSSVAETTTSTTATTGVPFVRNDTLRLEGDNISLASNASSLSTSSTVTTDSGTATTDSGTSICTVDGANDVFKRQSASSLSDLDHMGKL